MKKTHQQTSSPEQLSQLASALCSTVIDGVPGVAMATLAGDSLLLAEILAQGANPDAAIDGQGWNSPLTSLILREWQCLPWAASSSISQTTMPDAARGIFEDGDRALSGAAMMGKSDCVAVLLAAGADALAENAQGLTALEKMLDLNALTAWHGIHEQTYREIVGDLSAAMACADSRSASALARAAHRFEMVFVEMHVFTQASNHEALKKLKHLAEAQVERREIDLATESSRLHETAKQRL